MTSGGPAATGSGGTSGPAGSSGGPTGSSGSSTGSSGKTINMKNMDYFKFKRLVVDGCRDDYGCCSQEVRTLCDLVQTLTFRDDEFDDTSDLRRIQEIHQYYRQVLAGKRLEPADLRVKNGWWSDQADPGGVTRGGGGGGGGSGGGGKGGGGVYSASKFKAGALKVTLVAKARDWFNRHVDEMPQPIKDVDGLIEGRGVYVFRHKDRHCCQFVGRTAREGSSVFTVCSELLRASFDGSLGDPLSVLLVISMATDWDFYFIPLLDTDSELLQSCVENDVILKHDSIWPCGLNMSLNVGPAYLSIKEFRTSCLRHHWPQPSRDPVDKPIDFERLRASISAASHLTSSAANHSLSSSSNHASLSLANPSEAANSSDDILNLNGSYGEEIHSYNDDLRVGQFLSIDVGVAPGVPRTTPHPQSSTDSFPSTRSSLKSPAVARKQTVPQVKPPTRPPPSPKPTDRPTITPPQGAEARARGGHEAEERRTGSWVGLGPVSGLGVEVAVGAGRGSAQTRSTTKRPMSAPKSLQASKKTTSSPSSSQDVNKDDIVKRPASMTRSTTSLRHDTAQKTKRSVTGVDVMSQSLDASRLKQNLASSRSGTRLAAAVTTSQRQAPRAVLSTPQHARAAGPRDPGPAAPQACTTGQGVLPISDPVTLLEETFPTWKDLGEAVETRGQNLGSTVRPRGLAGPVALTPRSKSAGPSGIGRESGVKKITTNRSRDAMSRTSPANQQRAFKN